MNDEERIKKLEEKLEEMLRIFTHRLDEIEKRIIMIQREIKPIGFEDVFEYIRENIIVKKQDLISRFPFLLNKYNWIKFKNSLPNDILLLYYPGLNWGMRFVHLCEKEVEYAIKYFNQTGFGKTIEINCPDPEMKSRICYWLEKIFDGLITKSTTFPITYIRGIVVGVSKRGKRILKKEKQK